MDDREDPKVDETELLRDVRRGLFTVVTPEVVGPPFFPLVEELPTEEPPGTFFFTTFPLPLLAEF